MATPLKDSPDQLRAVIDKANAAAGSMLKAADEEEKRDKAHDAIIAAREKEGHIRIERNLFLVPLGADQYKNTIFEIQMGDVRIGEVSINDAGTYSLHWLVCGGNFCGGGQVDISKVSGRMDLVAHIFEVMAREARDQALEMEEAERTSEPDPEPGEKAWRADGPPIDYK